MTSVEIRKSFLDFFREKRHTIVASSSLLPDSPNLLFTNAGMNQFVPIFLGKAPCPYQPGRAADTQKCIRAGGKHNDLEDVGLDTYHHTFFEMLGNWSFGDYFKKEAIAWAWELVVGCWKFPASRVYATVYKPGPGDPADFDQEAYDQWAEIFKKAGLDPKVHIVYGNKKDNFWMMGDTGPCGPCSELHIDLTPAGDTKGALVNKGDARCIEIWNLVFIQFNANPDGTFSPLPAKHVDTGMGFERVASIIQGTKGFTDFNNAKISNYETDIFRPIFDELEKLSGKKYGSTLPKAGSTGDTEQEKTDVAFRVIADHIRTLSFSIADGILPSNEGRGYVLRRILRRAVRYGRQLGFHELFFFKLVAVLARTMGDVFPEIRKNQAQVEKTIRLEEESFSKTLDRGIELFESVVSKRLGGGYGVFPGDEAFKLYDTYGFPIDLTELMARERGHHVDIAEFERLMEEQRKRSREGQIKDVILAESAEIPALKVEFVGFDALEATAKVVRVENGAVVADRTPFYGEMGGQVGDAGSIIFNGVTIPIKATKKLPGGVPVHVLEKEADLKEGDSVTLKVDALRRERIQGHHSATHLMHWALRKVLGNTVAQKGSYVGPDRLRFDFSHLEAMTPEQIVEVEHLVNEKIDANDTVTWTERPYAQVKGDTSILQFFGDKYGENVRVVDIGGYSKELCGGTHVKHTEEIGFFKILSESAIAAGIRRIEAVAGPAVIDHVREEKGIQDGKHSILKNRHIDIGGLVDIGHCHDPREAWQQYATRQQQLKKLEEEVRDWEKKQAKEAESRWQKQAAEEAGALSSQAETWHDVPLVLKDCGDIPAAYLPFLADALKARWKGAAVLASQSPGRVALLASVHPDFTKKVQAGKIIQTIAPIVGGKGGGKPELAQGGGTKPGHIGDALAKVKDLW
jgi:alanyl-tRNA synthetase